jgi:hypothetical protein
VAILAAAVGSAGASASSPLAASTAGGAKVRHVVLKRGTLFGEPWHTTISANRPGSRIPCFGVTTQDSEAVDSFGECSRPTRVFIPLIMSDSGDPPNRGVVTLLVTPLKVHRVRLNFGGRPDKTVWPRRVARAKARRAGLKPDFRARSFARSGEFCLRRMVAFTTEGRVYLRTPRYPSCAQQRRRSQKVRSGVASRDQPAADGYLPAFAR